MNETSRSFGKSQSCKIDHNIADLQRKKAISMMAEEIYRQRSLDTLSASDLFDALLIAPNSELSRAYEAILDRKMNEYLQEEEDD